MTIVLILDVTQLSDLLHLVALAEGLLSGRMGRTLGAPKQTVEGRGSSIAGCRQKGGVSWDRAGMGAFFP